MQFHICVFFPRFVRRIISFPDCDEIVVDSRLVLDCYISAGCKFLRVGYSLGKRGSEICLKFIQLCVGLVLDDVSLRQHSM